MRVSVITLWLDRGRIEITRICLDADMATKERGFQKLTSADCALKAKVDPK
jgi:hypothetical protein